MAALGPHELASVERRLGGRQDIDLDARRRVPLVLPGTVTFPSRHAPQTGRRFDADGDHEVDVFRLLGERDPTSERSGTDENDVSVREDVDDRSRGGQLRGVEGNLHHHAAYSPR